MTAGCGVLVPDRATGVASRNAAATVRVNVRIGHSDVRRHVLAANCHRGVQVDERENHAAARSVGQMSACLSAWCSAPSRHFIVRDGQPQRGQV